MAISFFVTARHHLNSFNPWKSQGVKCPQWQSSRPRLLPCEVVWSGEYDYIPPGEGYNNYTSVGHSELWSVLGHLMFHTFGWCNFIHHVKWVASSLRSTKSCLGSTKWLLVRWSLHLDEFACMENLPLKWLATWKGFPNYVPWIAGVWLKRDRTHVLISNLNFTWHPHDSRQ